MADRHEAVDRIAAARTFLFVPGHRPDRFANASRAGADIVILDLEDAVPAAAKEAARESVRDWLASGAQALVRINADDTAWFEDDLELHGAPGLLGFMLPKARAGATIERVAALAPTVALIESAAGVARVDAVAGVTGVLRLAFGTIDLALDLGVTCPDAIEAIGTRLVIASRVQGLAAPVAGVTSDFREPATVETAMRQSRARGFGAKLCIHPAQVPAVRQAFIPGEVELAWARRIVAADRASNGGAVSVDGQMVDKPIVVQAHRKIGDAKHVRTAEGAST